MFKKTTALFWLGLLSFSAQAEVKVLWEKVDGSQATERFEFKNIPHPRKLDAAPQGIFTILEGAIDRFSGGLATLTNGELPDDEDDPAENFFFAAGTKGGSLLLDLGKVTSIKEVNSYSWHRAERAPQVYELYAADGTEPGLNLKPIGTTDLTKAGWKHITKVDTRSRDETRGGQFGVSIREASGHLGDYRYLLFQVFTTEEQDPFGQTFYSEIDVVSADAPPEEPRRAGNGKLSVVLDVTEAPDLEGWTKENMLPIVNAWYPKLSRLLASPGYEPPSKITLRYRTDMPAGVPASAGGRMVNLNAGWFRKNLEGEAVGSVIHELVHVIQNYSRSRNSSAKRTPGWVVEGIADYVRWFLYEPEAMGAQITAQNLSRAHYNSSYRITANFLNWIATVYGHEVIWNVNAAAREGRYSDDLWQEQTGRSLEQLGDDWRRVQQLRLERGKATNEKKE